MNGFVAALNYGDNDDYMEEESPAAATNLQNLGGIFIIQSNLHLLMMKGIHDPHEEFKK